VEGGGLNFLHFQQFVVFNTSLTKLAPW
jgi:hypothetical protein